ncbi:MAG: hypothetical protein GX960_14315, partial [Actinomycetales bacterium]|nr:hypothetical protein [Actinomycetales bacterium]
MSGELHGAADGAVESGARTDSTAASSTAAAGGTATDAASAAPASAAQDGSPAPLTSLTSLLGGTFEGGTTCTTDGACD